MTNTRVIIKAHIKLVHESNEVTNVLSNKLLEAKYKATKGVFGS